MKTHISCAILYFISILTFAQTNFHTLMGVTENDLRETNFTADTTANALVIYERGESYIDKESFYLTTKIERKIKIFNRNGFNQGTVEIPLYYDSSKKEKVHDIVATTFNLESGAIVKSNVEKSAIFNEEYNSRYNLVKFTFPNLKEGSVITYSYKKTSPFIFKYYPWEFQAEIPKLYSEYKTSIPANYDYNIKLIGSLPMEELPQEIDRSCIDVGNDLYADCTVSGYKMKNIPAFIEEEYMTTRDNYLARIEYELKTIKGFSGRVDHFAKSWKSVETEIEGDTDLGRHLKRTGIVQNLLDESITSISNPLERAKSIFYYIQENYTLNKKNNFLHDVSVKNVMDEKSGTVSEINALLHNLLSENGIEVNPVLISTRNNGFITRLYPVLSEFNYLLVRTNIAGKDYLLDASDKNVTFGEIPFRALNQYGRMLDFKGKSDWIDIKPEYPSVTQQRAVLKLNDETDKFNGTFKSRTTGYHSLKNRIAYHDNPGNYIDSNKRDYTNPEISNHEVLEADKKNPTFVESFDIIYTPETIGDKYFINPFMLKNFKSNPFKLQDRTYPVDFGFADSFNYSAKIEFGSNYRVETLPEERNLSLPNNAGTLRFSVQESEDSVDLVFKFDLKSAIYSPEYYPYIKEFISNIIDIQNNSLIVLKKK